MSRRPRRLIAIAVLLSFSACGVNGLSFVRDERVEIVSPEDRSKVRLPIEVRWTTGADSAVFAIFIDRAPQPPGETLDWLARDDEQCKVIPGCPDAAYFTSRNIYTTTQTHLDIDRLRETRREEERRFRDLHELVVVLLDDRGRRIGESAFSVEFELQREPAGMERNDSL